MTEKMQNEIALYHWRILYDLAYKIQKKKPWRTFKKEHIIAVSEPFMAKDYYCVFETHIDYPMIKVFCDEESLLNYLDLSVQPLIIDGKRQAAGFNQQAKAIDNCLFCLIFVQEYELNEEEKSLLQYIASQEMKLFYAENRYPSFHRLQYAKQEERLTDIEEMKVLVRILTQLCEIVCDDGSCRMIQGNTKGKERIFYRNHQNGAWVNEWLYIEKLRRSLQEYSLNNDFLQKRVAKLPQKENSYCELLRMYMPIPQWEDSLHGMYYPVYLIMVDLTSGAKVWQKSFVRDGNDEKLAREILESFASNLSEIGYKPKGLILSDDFLRRIFRDFCEKVRMDMIFTDEGILNMSLAKWEQMMQFHTEEQLDWVRKAEQKYIFDEDQSNVRQEEQEKKDEKEMKNTSAKILRMEDYFKKRT